jgi:hypothetical protein
VAGRVVLLNDAWVDVPAPEPPEGPCFHCGYDGPVIATRGPLRAVPHPVPALGVEGDPRPTVTAGGVRRQAVGAHELVFGPHADADPGALLGLVVARWADLRNDRRLRGFGATRRAATGRHPAWQVFAVPHELPSSAPGGWRDAERLHGERILDDGAATALLAWAPRVPFETWVLPAQGLAPFERSGPEVLAAVGVVMERALARIGKALRGCPIDLVIVDGEPFRIELLPRLAAPAAVEVATGVPVHGVFPEAAAEFLRDAGF